MSRTDLPEPSPRAGLPGLRASVRLAAGRWRAWAADPEHVRRAGRIALPVLVVAGLLLPPVSLGTRLLSIGYTTARPGRATVVRSDTPGAWLEIQAGDIARTTRVRLRHVPIERLPGDVDDLPPERPTIGGAFRIHVHGPMPESAWLVLSQVVTPDRAAFVDPYGWDGQSWRWLAPRYPETGGVRVHLPMSRFVPRWVVLTEAAAAATEVAATLLPPPATVPAAMAELPILEMRAYHLHGADGAVRGEAFPLPSHAARRYGVIDNLESERVRPDLLNNMLIRPEARQRHRQAIVDLVRRDDLDGIVLDYRGVAADLAPVYTDLVARLARDLRSRQVEVVVVVPMPQRLPGGWSSGGTSWEALQAAADAVRVRLPVDTPLASDALDSLVRWSLTQVERGRLQLEVPTQGRDIVEGEVRAIGFGDALGHILDTARAGLPARLTPGVRTTIELPTLRAAELGRDPGTGMWRFYYWDQNRRQHTIWLNDAAGLAPAFEVAARYRIGRVVLDGVSAGLDPDLWRMVRTFRSTGRVEATPSDYGLEWQLVDGRGQVLQEAIQPLGASGFTFTAPRADGTYRVGVNLVSADGRVAALGSAAELRVAPPPPPTPRPTGQTYYVAPTPIPYLTAPAPADEARLTRTPVPVSAAQPTTTGTPRPPDARVVVATAVLRAGPGVDQPVLTDLKSGELLEVIARTRDSRWLNVRLVKTGMEGWVLTEVLDVVTDLAAVPFLTTATPTAAATPRRQ